MRVGAGEAEVRRSEGQRAVATVAMVTPVAVGERSERSVLVMSRLSITSSIWIHVARPTGSMLHSIVVASICPPRWKGSITY
jgi:hypothetical protein